MASQLDSWLMTKGAVRARDGIKTDFPEITTHFFYTNRI